MKIELKNGKIVELDWNPIIFEYLSDYESGIEGMRQDISLNRNIIYVTNHIVYSVIRANILEDLNINQVLHLVKVEDIDRILDFVISQSATFLDNNQISSDITIKKH